MDVPPIYFLRHGETEWNRADRRQGRLGSDLTEKGIGQSQAMGRTLAGLIGADIANWTMVASPQERAVHSAKLVDEALGLGFTTDERLMEISMGSWEGFTWLEIEERWPGLGTGDHNTAHFQIPDGEPYAQVEARAVSWLDSLTGPTIVISHGIFGRVLRTVYAGKDQSGYADAPSAGQEGFFLLWDGIITRVDVDPSIR